MCKKEGKKGGFSFERPFKKEVSNPRRARGGRIRGVVQGCAHLVFSDIKKGANWEGARPEGGEGFLIIACKVKESRDEGGGHEVRVMGDAIGHLDRRDVLKVTAFTPFC
jgi:hypothetical protein